MLSNNQKQEASDFGKKFAKRVIFKIPNASDQEIQNYLKTALSSYFSSSQKVQRELYQTAMKSFSEEWKKLKKEVFANQN